MKVGEREITEERRRNLNLNKKGLVRVKGK